MTHTHDTLMEQAQVFASAWSLVGGRFDMGGCLDDAEDARAALSAALTEVLAERDTAHMDGYEGGKQEARDAAHAEIDALKAERDALIAELEAEVAQRTADWKEATAKNRDLQAEVERLKAQEPVAWTLTEELTKRETTTRAHLWFSDPVNCMWTPLYLASGAAQKENT